MTEHPRDELAALYDEYEDEIPDRMRDKFEAGQDRYGDAWMDRDPEYHLKRMMEEMYEFRQAVEHYRDEDKSLDEMADVINFGLMAMATTAGGEPDE